MGASLSVDLRPEEVRELEDATSLQPKQIKSLYKRFRRLDRSNRGTIAADDLLMIPELSMNPLASRLVTLFERDGEDRVNFRAFVAGLAAFSNRCRPEVRQRPVFRVFDCDGDGYIGREDLLKVLALMVGKTMSTAAVEATVARTLADADVDRDGRISFADFDASLSSVIAWDLFHVPLTSQHRWEAEAASGFTSPPSFARLAAAGAGAGAADGHHA